MAVNFSVLESILIIFVYSTIHLPIFDLPTSMRQLNTCPCHYPSLLFLNRPTRPHARDHLRKPVHPLHPRRLSRSLNTKQHTLDPHADGASAAGIAQHIQTLLKLIWRVEGTGLLTNLLELLERVHVRHGHLAVEARGEVELVEDGALRCGADD